MSMQWQDVASSTVAYLPDVVQIIHGDVLHLILLGNLRHTLAYKSYTMGQIVIRIGVDDAIANRPELLADKVDYAPACVSNSRIDSKNQHFNYSSSKSSGSSRLVATD